MKTMINKYIKNLLLVFILALILTFASCNHEFKTNASPFKVEHPDWSFNATIYEVNIRQFTPEGTFAAFEKHLPRLNDLGVSILWIMPIHPVGEVEQIGRASCRERV